MECQVQGVQITTPLTGGRSGGRSGGRAGRQAGRQIDRYIKRLGDKDTEDNQQRQPQANQNLHTIRSSTQSPQQFLNSLLYYNLRISVMAAFDTSSLCAKNSFQIFSSSYFLSAF
jgi:cytochrome P450